MPRAITIAIWIVGTCAAWVVLCIGGIRLALQVNPAGATAFLKHVPPIALLSTVLTVGPAILMALTAYLGLTGKLPGTRHRPPANRPPSAFPVVTRTAEAESP